MSQGSDHILSQTQQQTAMSQTGGADYGSNFKAGPLGSGMAGPAGGNGTSGTMDAPYGASAKGGGSTGAGYSNTGIQEQSLSDAVPHGAGVAPAVEQGFGLVSGGGQSSGFPGGATTYTQNPHDFGTGSSAGGQGSGAPRDRAHREDEQRYNTAHALADNHIAEEAAAAGRAVTGHIHVPHYKSEEPHIAQEASGGTGYAQQGQSGRGSSWAPDSGAGSGAQAPAGASLANAGVASKAADVGAKTMGHHNIPEYESEKPIKPAAVGAMSYTGAGGASRGDRSPAQTAPPSSTQSSATGANSPYAAALNPVTDFSSTQGAAGTGGAGQYAAMAQERAQPVLNAAGQYAAVAQEKAQPVLNAAGQYAAVAQEKAQPALDAAKGYAVQAQQMAQPHVDQAMDYAAGVAQQAQLKTQEVVGQVREADLEGLAASPTVRIAAAVFLLWLVLPFSLPWKAVLSLMVVGGIVAGLAVYARNRSGQPLMPARKGNTLGSNAPPSTGAGTYNSAARRY